MRIAWIRDLRAGRNLITNSVRVRLLSDAGISKAEIISVYIRTLALVIGLC